MSLPALEVLIRYELGASRSSPPSPPAKMCRPKGSWTFGNAAPDGSMGVKLRACGALLFHRAITELGDWRMPEGANQRAVIFSGITAARHECGSSSPGSADRNAADPTRAHGSVAEPETLDISLFQ